VKSSGVFNGDTNYSANHLVDGRAKNIFKSSSKDSAWIQIDLGFSAYIDRINYSDLNDIWAAESQNFTTFISDLDMSQMSLGELQSNGRVYSWSQKENAKPESHLFNANTSVTNFTNFQNIAGTNFGDDFVIRNTQSVKSIRLGAGHNIVKVYNSKGLTLSGGMGLHDVLVQDSTVGVLTTGSSAMRIEMLGESVLSGSLSGVSEEVDASDSGRQTISLEVGTGSRTIIVANDVLVLTLNRGEKGGTTKVVHDSHKVSSDPLSITLNFDEEDTLIRLEKHSEENDTIMEIFEKDSLNRLYYSYENPEYAKSVNLSYLNGPSELSAAMLVQAMASMTSDFSNYVSFENKNYFKFDSVLGVLASMA
jgi:hypothetical protein